jgi:hypothetical protein
MHRIISVIISILAKQLNVIITFNTLCMNNGINVLAPVAPEPENVCQQIRPLHYDQDRLLPPQVLTTRGIRQLGSLPVLTYLPNSIGL